MKLHHATVAKAEKSNITISEPSAGSNYTTFQTAKARSLRSIPIRKLA